MYCSLATLMFYFQMILFGASAMPGWEGMKAADYVSIVVYGALTMLGLWMPICLAKAIGALDTDITLASDFKWPKHGLKVVVSGLITTIGLFLIDLEYCDSQFRKYNVTTQQSIIYFSVYISSSLIGSILGIIHAILFLIIAERVGEKCQRQNKRDDFEEASKCLFAYQDLKQKVGKYIFLNYGGAQMYTIIAIYLALRIMFDASQDWFSVSTCVGYLLILLAMLLILTGQGIKNQMHVN